MIFTCQHDSCFDTVTKQHTVSQSTCTNTDCQVMGECFSLDRLLVGFLQLCSFISVHPLFSLLMMSGLRDMTWKTNMQNI